MRNRKQVDLDADQARELLKLQAVCAKKKLPVPSLPDLVRMAVHYGMSYVKAFVTKTK